LRREEAAKEPAKNRRREERERERPQKKAKDSKGLWLKKIMEEGGNKRKGGGEERKQEGDRMKLEGRECHVHAGKEAVILSMFE
jgi:hypothetical protein